MVDFEQLQASIEYKCLTNLNLYDSPSGDRLATQAAVGRHLCVLSLPENSATSVQVCLCEDGYSGWLSMADIRELEIATTPYHGMPAASYANALSEAEIRNRIPEIITFTQKAMQVPNYYLWGGTVKPNYDCSGLMQAAFADSGIWLPRDAYQQEAFTRLIAIEDLLPGDLVFFGVEKATHVGLYLGDGRYIHSSGQQMGRNGIAIDRLSEQGDEISQSYYRQLRCYGRVVKSYEPN